jgi:transposase
MRRASRVEISAAERRQLEAWARAGPSRRRLSRRARIVIEAASGATNAQIAARLGVHQETVARWRARFVLNGLEGISREAPRAGAPSRVPRATVARIVRASLARRPTYGGHWTTRSLARSLRVNHMLVHRVWSSHGLGNRPAPLADAGVRPRVDLGGAFVTRAARALVFTVDERPSPLPGRPALPELVPNPTTRTEFSGPEALSREVVRAVGTIQSSSGGATSSSEAALLVFLRGVEHSAHRSRRLEVVFDRSLARLGRRVRRWLETHARFRVFTPARHQPWSEAVDAWLRRWEAGGLDRSSLGLVPVFAQQFAANPSHQRAPVGPARSFWAPSSGLEPETPRPAALAVPLREGTT